MSGRMKLRRDQSSARLFCSGVPVSRRRLAASYDLRALCVSVCVCVCVCVYLCMYVCVCHNGQYK